MSKQVVSIPLYSIERISVLLRQGRSLAQVKGSADHIINGSFYDMSTGKPTDHLKADGGGSSHYSFPEGGISSSSRVHNYIAVWLKKSNDKPESEEGEVKRAVRK